MHLFRRQGKHTRVDKIYIRFDAGFHTNRARAEDSPAQDSCPGCSLAPRKQQYRGITLTRTDPAVAGLRPERKRLKLNRNEKTLF